MALTLEKIGDRDCTVGIVGLGYVGFPLAMAFAGGGSRFWASTWTAVKST